MSSPSQGLPWMEDHEPLESWSERSYQVQVPLPGPGRSPLPNASKPQPRRGETLADPPRSTCPVAPPAMAQHRTSTEYKHKKRMVVSITCSHKNSHFCCKMTICQAQAKLLTYSFHFISSSPKPYGIGEVIIPILKLRMLRPREV